MKERLKQACPDLYNYYFSLNVRRQSMKRFGKSTRLLAEALFPEREYRVLNGPFAGMKYIHEPVWGPLGPKWIGSYEAELHGITDEIIEHGYDRVIDIGCAEGYYAVGLAYRSRKTMVFAFDIDPVSRRQTKRMSVLNGVEDRVILNKICRHEDLNLLAHEGSLVVCDVEGYEKILLDPVACPSLKSVDLLIEMHETDSAETLRTLFVQRFASTHDILDLPIAPRSDWITKHKDQFDGLLSEVQLSEYVEEYRNDNYWFWLKRKSEP